MAYGAACFRDAVVELITNTWQIPNTWHIKNTWHISIVACTCACTSRMSFVVRVELSSAYTVPRVQTCLAQVWLKP